MTTLLTASDIRDRRDEAFRRLDELRGHSSESGLWTPDKYPTKPLIAPSGNLVVVRPLNLIAMMEEEFRNAWEDRKAVEAGISILSRQHPVHSKRRIALIRGAAAGAWTFTNTTRTNILNALHDIDSDTHKMALFLSTSDLGATENTYAGVTNEHANANGYTTGGASISLTLAGTTTVTVDIATDPVWTASGGSITARFAAIYEVSGNVICYCLLDSTPADVTATDGNTLTVAAHASGVFTLA